MYIVLVVEGETDKEFFDSLIAYYRVKSKKQVKNIKVLNIKGIGRYESKLPSKLKYEIIPKCAASDIAVVCSYDTDVFELAQKPPVNWNDLKNKVLKIKGIQSFHEIKAHSMIEDWFLKDLEGICKYLKIDTPTKLIGKSGNDKMKWLFKRGKKIYQKGSSCHKFVPSLNIEFIRTQIKVELKELEEILNVEL